MLRREVIGALRGRFDRRLTVIVAGAGFGKTTALAQAVRENRIERWGIDAWLRCRPGDQDPGQLLGALSRSLTGAEPGRLLTPEELADQVWSQAPESVAFVLDDTQVLGDESWAALRDLLDQLPDTGHLVVAGRTPAQLPVARLLASEEALVLDESLLGFSPDELQEFGDDRDLGADLIGQLPSWPALATLQSTVGRAASASFVWDEVLAPLPAWQTRMLALAAPFDVLDDALVRALEPTGGRTAAMAVDGVPLVQSDGNGAYRMHALLADVVRVRVAPEEQAAALATASRALLDAGADRRAVEAAALAGDHAILHEAVCRFFTRPIRSISVPEVVALQQRLPPEMQGTALGCFLDAARTWESGVRDAAARFAHSVEQAREEGDTEVEALATWRVCQLRYLEDPAQLEVEPRHEALAALGAPLARSTVAFIRSVEAQRGGDVRASIAALDALDDTDQEQRRETIALRMFDLGHSESIPATVEDLLAGGVVDLFAAQSLWLRGEVPADLAWEVARSMPGVAGRAGVQHEQVSVRATVSLVAISVGELDEADRLLDGCRNLDPHLGKQVGTLVQVADAIRALCADGEAAGVARFRAVLAHMPLDRFPARAYLYALAPIRGLVPEAAATIDALDLGPALATSVAAGRALADLRASGDLTGAAALPWATGETMRSVVPPPLFAELALAASTAGVADATDLLARVPDLRTWLDRIAASDGAIAGAARAHLADLPSRPPYDLHITTFGGLHITRSDDVAVDASRTSRARVRQILARLLLRQRLHRAELAAALWPDLPDEAASGNLRVNLRHLLAALQPDRGPAEPSWFVQSDGESIWLADEGISIDIPRFDHHVRRAVEAEANGLPSSALVDLRAAAALYAGDLLPGVDDAEVELERLRLRSVALSVQCRTGELVLARGEPEAAMHDAVAALRLEPSSERATRLFIRCHLAVGSTAAAREVAQRLVRDLDDLGVRPEPETEALLSRLSVSPAAR